LAAVEEHERSHCHWLHDLLPEGLQRDLFSGDEDELALTLLDIVEPVQYLLSVLQKARRHVLASPPLVTSDEMMPLGLADRHPAPSQKLPTLGQPTPPAAPASAPPLLSALIALSSLSLNLPYIDSPSQTGDSNLVANKTIDSRHRKKVPQQKGRRHAPVSPTLVVSDEMTPLGPANQHPAILQKLPTSKQLTPPATSASAPPLSSTLIAPSPLSLNLPYINPPSQTGDSHLVAYTTISSNRKEKVQQQQGQDIGRPASNLVVKVTQSMAISPGHWGFVLKMRSPTRAGGFVWKYSPLLECCNSNLFLHTVTTVDTVIPSSSTVVNRPPSLLPFPIDDQGQPLFSLESTSSHTDQVPIDEDSKEAIFAVQKTGSPAVKQWHPTHSCFPSPCSFFFLFPF